MKEKGKKTGHNHVGMYFPCRLVLRFGCRMHTVHAKGRAEVAREGSFPRARRSNNGLGSCPVQHMLYLYYGVAAPIAVMCC